MLKHTNLTLARLRTFANGANLRGRIYPEKAPAALAAFAAPDRIPFDEAMRGSYSPIVVGHRFGPVWSTHWVRVEATFPAAWHGREVHLLWDSASEACVWIGGQPIQGLTGLDHWSAPRKEFILTRDARGGEKLVVFLEVACNGMFGLPEPSLDVVGKLRQAEIAVFDRDAWALLWDFTVIADMAERLPPDTPRSGQALAAANAMTNVCNLEDKATWPQARKIAAGYLAEHNGDGQHNLSIIGHAHIDTAWLWPLAETRRKCVRSFVTALQNMDEYPEYLFVCSQAQQYEWIKQDQPALYERIRARVAEERFVPAGGTWVEPDCNLPSGESLVRQFLFGQRFFEREFGRICSEFWNPDVFGYSAQLPQIMRGAGITRFLTQKLSWNQFNKIPSHSFHWEGIDGSRVLTHFPPADTYNAEVSVEQVLYNVRNFKDHERSRESYMLFGYGDGGGGPTREMIERARRMADVDGLPRVQHRSPSAFFARIEAEHPDLSVWVGELYFELHRGTYTSQARNKASNRRAEEMLHDVEFLAAVAHAQGLSHYPVEAINALWKTVLLNQFHDIIPGSSIAEVYRDSDTDYARVMDTAATLRERAIAAFNRDEAAHGANVMVVNTLGHSREEIGAIPETAGGQILRRGTNGERLALLSAPSAGIAVIDATARPARRVTLTENDDSIILESDYLRAQISRTGALLSLFDKRADRESLSPGWPGNAFALFDDEPIKWDAWDVDVYHLEKRYDVDGAQSLRVLERGPLRAAVQLEYALSDKSTLRQIVRLSALAPYLEFDTEVDWHERHKFLKVDFPVDVRAPDASYEIQFGHVRRPTHFNTSWDVARFEVCAHRWADVSETGFGVALLNDSKYGYAIHGTPGGGSLIRLSLLRSPQYPDPGADQGAHRFRYALLPHADGPMRANIAAVAHDFNSPLLARATSLPPQCQSFFSVDNPNVVIDTVKRAEDSDALIIRLFEARGGRSRARLISTLKIARAWRCDLLERDVALLVEAGGPCDLTLKPFEIMTLKLEVVS